MQDSEHECRGAVLAATRSNNIQVPSSSMGQQQVQMQMNSTTCHQGCSLCGLAHQLQLIRQNMFRLALSFRTPHVWSLQKFGEN
jgi:hypothetical protein